MKPKAPYRIVFGLSFIWAGLLGIVFVLPPIIGFIVPIELSHAIGHSTPFFPILNNIILFSLLLHKVQEQPLTSSSIKYTIIAPSAIYFLSLIVLSLFGLGDLEPVEMFGIVAVIATSLTFIGVSYVIGFGNRKTRDTHLRGARLVSSSANKNQVSPGAITFGGQQIAEQHLTKGVLISGSVGSGKSVAINEALRAVRWRGNRAMIIDPSSGFYEKFYSAEAGDILFNLMDDRSPPWSPFAEIKEVYDFDRMAKALIPDAMSGEDKFFPAKARQLVTDVMTVMHERGDNSPRSLYKWLMASAESLGDFLEGTPSAADCAPANAKMFGSVRATMSVKIRWLSYLPESENYFSIRQWIRNESSKGWLYITYQNDQMDLLSNFVSTITDIALLEALSLPINFDRRLFFVLDEVDALGPIGQLKNALVRVRKHGGVCIVGVQTIAQLRDIYGRDTSIAILGNTVNKLIMRPSDPETAKENESMIGEHEIERETTSTATAQGSSAAGTRGSSHASTTTTTNRQVVRQTVIMASELLGIPDLDEAFRGVLLRPGEPHTIVDVPLVKMPSVAKPFVPRKAQKLMVKDQAAAS